MTSCSHPSQSTFSRSTAACAARPASSLHCALARALTVLSAAASETDGTLTMRLSSRMHSLTLRILALHRPLKHTCMGVRPSTPVHCVDAICEPVSDATTQRGIWMTRPSDEMPALTAWTRAARLLASMLRCKKA